MDCALLSVFEEPSEEALASLLNSEDRLRSESDLWVLRSSNLTAESLEGELGDHQFCALLQLPDLPERHCPRSSLVPPLHRGRGENLSLGILPRHCFVLSLENDGAVIRGTGCADPDSRGVGASCLVGARCSLGLRTVGSTNGRSSLLGCVGALRSFLDFHQ